MQPGIAFFEVIPVADRFTGDRAIHEEGIEEKAGKKDTQGKNKDSGIGREQARSWHRKISRHGGSHKPEEEPHQYTRSHGDQNAFG